MTVNLKTSSDLQRSIVGGLHTAAARWQLHADLLRSLTVDLYVAERDQDEEALNVILGSIENCAKEMQSCLAERNNDVELVF